MVPFMLKRFVVLLVLIVVGLFAAGCSARKTETATSAAAVVTAVSAVPVVETRVVTETLKIPVTVVVTATPIPTPMYASKVNAASGVLVYPIASEPASLDPQDADDEVSTLVAAQLYEGLFDLDANGAIVPAAAQEVMASPDSKTYTVTLRSGMTWSDGQPVTAQNYVDGVCRLLDPAVGNPYYYLLTDIAGVTRAKGICQRRPGRLHQGRRQRGGCADASDRVGTSGSVPAQVVGDARLLARCPCAFRSYQRNGCDQRDGADFDHAASRPGRQRPLSAGGAGGKRPHYLEEKSELLERRPGGCGAG